MISDEDFITDASKIPSQRKWHVGTIISIALCFVLSFVLIATSYPQPHYEKASERAYGIGSFSTGIYEYYIYTEKGIFILNKTIQDITFEAGNRMVLHITDWNLCDYRDCWPDHATYTIYL